MFHNYVLQANFIVYVFRGNHAYAVKATLPLLLSLACLMIFTDPVIQTNMPNFPYPLSHHHFTMGVFYSPNTSISQTQLHIFPFLSSIICAISIKVSYPQHILSLHFSFPVTFSLYQPTTGHRAGIEVLFCVETMMLEVSSIITKCFQTDNN